MTTSVFIPAFAGYEARDYIANPGVHYVVEPLQAFAWNPSVPGAKSEDTFIVSEAGAELLSPTPDWPYIQVETGIGTIQRPDILEL